MREFKFNEQSAIENMIKVKFVDRNNVTNTIFNLAKYNYHVLNLGDQANYNHVLKYITENCDNIYEEGIYKDIKGCVKDAKKYTFASIDEVCITESEIRVIKALNDIKQEKAAFVLLAVSKYFNSLNDTTYDSAFLTNTDICKMARITIPVDKRDEFMQFAYDKEILHRHTYSDSTIKKVTFISHDENDKVVLRLKENDFKDLAYTYLAYKTPLLFRRCVACSCWIKKDSRDRRLCKECSDKSVEEKNTIKEIQCVDCGKSVYVSVLNTKTCRCDECQSAINVILNKEKCKRYRESKRHRSLENLEV